MKENYSFYDTPFLLPGHSELINWSGTAAVQTICKMESICI